MSEAWRLKVGDNTTCLGVTDCIVTSVENSDKHQLVKAKKVVGDTIGYFEFKNDAPVPVDPKIYWRPNLLNGFNSWKPRVDTGSKKEYNVGDVYTNGKKVVEARTIPYSYKQYIRTEDDEREYNMFNLEFGDDVLENYRKNVEPKIEIVKFVTGMKVERSLDGMHDFFEGKIVRYW